MATVAEFPINADDFPLGEVFKDMPGVRAELERVVPTSEVISLLETGELNKQTNKYTVTQRGLPEIEARRSGKASI